MKVKFVYYSLSDTGKVRKANEDFYGDELTQNGHVFVVCDGMGGHMGGAEASQLAVSSILEYFREHQGNSPQELIKQAIKFANTQVHGYATMNPELRNMGTTCVLLLLGTDGNLYYGHVGDSRIYQYYQGQLTRLTKDHSYVQFLVDSGEITEEEMETHPNRNQILRALGIDEEVKVDVAAQSIAPQEGTMLLLCSDGLSGMVSDAQIKVFLDEFHQHKTQKTVERLIEEALKNGGKDNVTATLLYFDSPDTTLPIPPVSEASRPEEPIAAPPKGKVSRKTLTWALLFIVLSVVALIIAFNPWAASPPQKEEEKKEQQGDSTVIKSKGSHLNTEQNNIRTEEEKKDTANTKETGTGTDSSEPKETQPEVKSEKNSAKKKDGK